MKFKIGDKVKIISLKYTGVCFGLNKSKRSLLDKTVIIQDISSACSYIINGWNFHVYDLCPITTDLEIE